MITGKIRIAKEQEKRFKEQCSNSGIMYELIDIDESDPRYFISAESVMDVFTIGLIVGIWAITDKEKV